MGKVKQSHYLPRASYLSKFSSEGSIWVYNLSSGKDDFVQSEPFKTTPKKFGRKNYLYEVPGLPENLLEKVLQPIEDAYGHLFDKKISKHIELSREELEVVSLFISTLEARVPAQKEHWDSQMDEVKHQGIRIALANNSKVAADKFEREMDKVKLFTFANLISAAIKVNRWRFADYCFLYIEREEADQYFITSDHPTCLIDYASMNTILGIAPMSRTLELTVPLSRNMALFVNNSGISGYKKVDANFVREVNNRTVNQSSGYLVAPKELNDYFYNGVYKRYPQSLILRYAKLPEGNVDIELKKLKKQKH